MTDLYSYIINDEERNNLIIDNICEEYDKGNNIIVLSDRIEHVNLLSKVLIDKKMNVLPISGASNKKERMNFRDELKSISTPFIIVSTGKFIGEGFDDDRLTSLFLTTPFKWKGTLSQYVGRLNRVKEGKNEVFVHDFIDINIIQFSRMFSKRLKGYKDLGYVISSIEEDAILLSNDNYEKKLIDDIELACNNIKLYINYANPKKLEFLINKIKVKHVVYSNNNYKNAIRVSPNTIIDNIIVFDDDIIWYGGINPFIFKNEDNSIMRLKDRQYAKQLNNTILHSTNEN